MISGLLLTIAEAQSHNAKNHSQAAEAIATTLRLHSDHQGPDLFNTAHGPRSCRPIHLSALYFFRRPMLQGILINLTFPLDDELFPHIYMRSLEDKNETITT